MPITYTCRIAFVSNPFDAAPTWVDVSSSLMNFHIRRGRQWELNRMEAGTANIRLRNLAGDFWPNNSTGAYTPNVLPWKRVNIRAALVGVTVALSPGTMADDASVGTVAWNFPDSAKVPGSGSAYVPGSLSTQIPIENSVKIVTADGAYGATDKSTSAATLTDLSYYSYGSSTDLWGDTWTPAQINDVDFGFIISVKFATTGTISHYLKATNFGFAIPSGATINGILVEVAEQSANTIARVDHIRITVYYTMSTYDLYTGYIESWQPDFILRPIKAPVMDLSCADGIKNLSQYLLNNSTGYAQELSGIRIDNVLTTIGWPSTARDLDAGQSPIVSTGPLVNVNSMTHVFTVEDTEVGIFFESPSGAMVFQDRHARLIAPYTTPQAYFGDTATSNGYTGITLSYEDLRIYNDLRVTRLGSTTEQVATSTTSADAYGPRSLQRPSLLMVTDAEALAQAQYLLARYKDPAMRCKQIEIRPNSDPADLYPCVLGYDISTRINIKLTQASLNRDYHIEGIAHDWDVLDAAGLKTTWWLTDVAGTESWMLDTSALGSTTILGF